MQYSWFRSLLIRDNHFRPVAAEHPDIFFRENHAVTVGHEYHGGADDALKPESGELTVEVRDPAAVLRMVTVTVPLSPGSRTAGVTWQESTITE
jgi:hypothetical protein